MIKRFIKQKSITVTKAMNSYGEMVCAVTTSTFAECFWISVQHFRLNMSKQFQQYLQISDAHLQVVQLELEKRCRVFSDIDFNSELLLENAGNMILSRSTMPCREIVHRHGSLEHCIPFPSDDASQLAHSLINHCGKYEWIKCNYKEIPFGKVWRSDVIEQMRIAFNGRIPGKHIWHTHKK